MLGKVLVMAPLFVMLVLSLSSDQRSSLTFKLWQKDLVGGKTEDVGSAFLLPEAQLRHHRCRFDIEEGR